MRVHSGLDRRRERGGWKCRPDRWGKLRLVLATLYGNLEKWDGEKKTHCWDATCLLGTS